MSSMRVGFRFRFTSWVQASLRYHTGWALALFATLCFSMAAPLIRHAIIDGFDPVALLMARMLLASVLLGITLGAISRRELILPHRGMAACALVGSINAGGMVLFFIALGLLEASLASMILALSPPVVLSLLALRGERLTQRHWVRLGLATLGVYLLVGPSGQVNWFGVGLALLATFLFSLQMALTQWTLAPYPTRTVAFYVTAWMTACVIGWWLLRGAVWSPPSPAGWLTVIALAIVSTYLARLAFFAAVGSLGSAQVSLLGPVETLLSVTWSVLFLQEWLTFFQWIGGGLILCSALLAAQRLGRVNLRLPRR
uniref:DMT family transporter n=1 Tax=Caldilinea aerophila TaxID=133453 RepID=A0A7C1JQF8_9CHLR